MNSETRHEASLHLVAYGAVGALIIGMLGMTHAYNRELAHEAAANEAANHWSTQAAQANVSFEQMTTQRDELQAQLDQLSAITPTERIVVQPCVEPDQVPVFSRESQFVGAER